MIQTTVRSSVGRCHSRQRSCLNTRHVGWIDPKKPTIPLTPKRRRNDQASLPTELTPSQKRLKIMQEALSATPSSTPSSSPSRGSQKRLQDIQLGLSGRKLETQNITFGEMNTPLKPQEKPGTTSDGDSDEALWGTQSSSGSSKEIDRVAGDPGRHTEKESGLHSKDPVC